MFLFPSQLRPAAYGVRPVCFVPFFQVRPSAEGAPFACQDPAADGRLRVHPFVERVEFVVPACVYAV